MKAEISFGHFKSPIYSPDMRNRERILYFSLEQKSFEGELNNTAAYYTIALCGGRVGRLRRILAYFGRRGI